MGAERFPLCLPVNDRWEQRDFLVGFRFAFERPMVGEALAQLGDLHGFRRRQVRLLVRVLPDVVELQGVGRPGVVGRVLFQQLPVALPNHVERVHHLRAWTFGALGNGFPGIQSIERQAGVGFRPSQPSQRGKQVHHMEQRVAFGPCRDPIRPPKRGGTENAALIVGPLGPSVGLVRFVVGAIVIQEHEQRIVERVLRLQRGDDPAHRDIHGIEHRELSAV